MPSQLGSSSNVYWLRPITDARVRVVSQLGLGTRLTSIISSNWRMAARTAKAIYRSYAGKSAIEPKVAIVMQQDVRKGACVGIYQDGRNVVDFVDGDDLMGR
jgi:hypothetical protein